MNSIQNLFRKTCVWCAVGIISFLSLLTVIWSVLLVGSSG